MSGLAVIARPIRIRSQRGVNAIVGAKPGVKVTVGRIAQPGTGGGAVDSVNAQTGVVVLDADDVGAAPAYLVPFSGTVAASDVFDDLLPPGWTTVPFGGATVAAGRVTFDLTGVEFGSLESPSGQLDAPTAPAGMVFAGVRVSRAARSSATGAVVSLRLSDSGGAIWPVGVQTSSAAWVATTVNELVAASIDTADGAWVGLTIDDATARTGLALNVNVSPQMGAYPATFALDVEWLFRPLVALESSRLVPYDSGGRFITATNVGDALDLAEGGLDADRHIDDHIETLDPTSYNPGSGAIDLTAGAVATEDQPTLANGPAEPGQTVLIWGAGSTITVANGTTTPVDPDDPDAANLQSLWRIGSNGQWHRHSMAAGGTEANQGPETNYATQGTMYFCPTDKSFFRFDCTQEAGLTGHPIMGANRPGDWVHIPNGGGAGDVVGPSSSNDGRPAKFDGASGNLLKQGAADNTVGGYPTLTTGPLIQDQHIGSNIVRHTEMDSAIAAAIDALVGGAPGALDTLNELAAALGDDAAFATSVTNALAGKVSTSLTLAGLNLSTNRTAAELRTALDVGGDRSPRQTGAWYSAAAARGGQYASNRSDSTAGRAWYAWLDPGGRSRVLEAVGIRVTNTPSTGTKLRLAVQALGAGGASLDNLFAAVLADSGQLAAEASGMVQMTGMSITIPPEGAWLGLVGQNLGATAPQIRTCNEVATAQTRGPAPLSSDSDPRGGALHLTGVTGAFPSSPTGIGNAASVIGWHIPDFYVRWG